MPRPLLSLAAAGALWGLTVPLTKLALPGLGPGWLTVIRFGLAAPVLALAGRPGLRQALRAPVLVAGAVGFGAVILLQNAGIANTSVSHAAVIVGAVPALVALLTSGAGQGPSGLRPWLGYGLALAGVGLVAGAAGHGATMRGDLLVLASVVLSAGFIVAQPRVLRGRDPAAVTAIEFSAGALVAVPASLLWPGAHGGPGGGGQVIALAALVLAGTVAPFWLFAYGQSRLPAHVAGAFVNLEPLVGALLGWVAFADAITPGQMAGAAAVLAGIGLSSLPVPTGRRPGDRPGAETRSRGRPGWPRPRIGPVRP